MLLLSERCARGSLVILCYHRVLPTESKAGYFLPDLVVTPEAFRRQCMLLRRYFDVMPLYEAYKALDEGKANRRPIAAITFDDGYQDNARYAVPILSEIGLKATFFVIADLVDTKSPPWYDKLGRAYLKLTSSRRIDSLLADVGIKSYNDRLRANGIVYPSPRHVIKEVKKLQPTKRHELVEQLCVEAGTDDDLSTDDLIMNWEQLDELTAIGHEIGSHSAQHEMLRQLDDASLDAEVQGSRRTLERGIGCQVHSFCYPNGDVDERITRAVEMAGYRCAVTTQSGINADGQNHYLLRRRFIHEERLAGLNGLTSDTLLRMELCGLADRVFGRRIQRDSSR